MDSAWPPGPLWPGHSATASSTGLAAATSGRFSSSARSASASAPVRARSTRSGWPLTPRAARANSLSAAPFSRCTPKASATPSMTAMTASTMRPGWSRQAGQQRWRHRLVDRAKRSSVFPDAVVQNLVWREAGLVGHLGALRDPVAQIQMAELEFPGLLDLPHHAVGAEAAFDVGVVEGVDRRQAVAQDVEDGHHA